MMNAIAMNTNPISGKHLSSQFEADLNELAARIMAMGGLIENQLDLAAAAMSTGADVSKLAEENERNINAIEREVDAHSAFLIASRQPAAQDLRYVLSMLKVCNNLERVGDEAVKLCLRSAGMKGMRAAGDGDLNPLSTGIMTLLGLAREMTVNALDCIARLSVKDAKAVLTSDVTLDASYRALIASLIQAMTRYPTEAASLVEVLFLAKAVERIGDHATNIAEAVIYIVNGEDVRHAQKPLA